MKLECKLTRRRFVKLCGIATLGCAATALTGCGKKAREKSKSKQELILGEWYAGFETPSWTFYDDGTCKLIGDYGLGKWSLVNDDTILNVSDFYGETHSYNLVSVDENQLTISADGGNGTVELSLYRSYEESMENGNYNY